MFRTKNLYLVHAAVECLERERPMTLRHLLYRLVSSGDLPGTDKKHYNRLGRIMTRLREAGEVPLAWIVDHVRATLKPSSWSGLADFADTVRDAYRKDFWASLDHHVEIFVEKDAIAGTIQPVTADYDVALRVVRGYTSVSFAGEIADEWKRIEKPIYAYYVGDFDPSGFDLERDLREKLARYSGRHCYRSEAFENSVLFSWSVIDSGVFVWRRLAIQEEDFEDHGLIALPVKQLDRRAKGFVREHGAECAEVDALPPTELRARVQAAIESHIDQERWAKLQLIQDAEKATWLKSMKRLGKAI
jgi:hypothetical protein